MSRRLAAGAAALVAALAWVATASADRWQIQLRPAAQTIAAKAVVLGRDLGAGWSGGRVEPDLTNLVCPGYAPKQRDLVVTGAADSRLAKGDAVVDAEIIVLRTRQMVALDWKRSVQNPAFAGCVRRTVSGGTPLDSFTRLTLPRIAPYVSGFRATLRVVDPNGIVRQNVVELIAIGKGRAEISVGAFGPVSAATLHQAALRAARAAVSRLPA